MEKAQKGDLIRVTRVPGDFVEHPVEGAICEVYATEKHGVLAYAPKPSDGDVDTTFALYIRDVDYVIHRKAGEEDSEVIAGVGPNAPIVTNEVGAKQSHSPYRMDLIDAKALLKIAQVHKQGGDKYGDTNWRGIPVNDHINHALVHIYAHLAGDTSDEHLSHAATRMVFALAQELKSTQN